MPIPDDHPGIAALRARGFSRLDPIRFQYLDALARRAAGLQGDARQVLDGKLTQLLAAATLQADTLRAKWDQAIPALVQRHPQAEPRLRQLHAQGDARAMRRLVAQLDGQPRGSPVGDLLRFIEQRTQLLAGDARDDGFAHSLLVGPGSLKSVQRHQEVWVRLRVDQQLTRSRRQAPENPGPLNSHLLVLRSLRRMQEIAPAYLAQFMAYAESLLSLDQPGSARAAAPAKAARPVPDRRKPVRGRGKSA